eukprot:GHVU01013086.1.p1 GENE.GHVU01013086.1~~GHVU01013086.1.p1  ORF type:complete len:286 (+),score=26.89 GHVU01013086.1:1151-2008(+)
MEVLLRVIGALEVPVGPAEDEPAGGGGPEGDQTETRLAMVLLHQEDQLVEPTSLAGDSAMEGCPSTFIRCSRSRSTASRRALSRASLACSFAADRRYSVTNSPAATLKTTNSPNTVVPCTTAAAAPIPFSRQAHKRTHTHADVRTHTRTHTHTHARTHTHAHTYEFDGLVLFQLWDECCARGAVVEATEHPVLEPDSAGPTRQGSNTHRDTSDATATQRPDLERGETQDSPPGSLITPGCYRTRGCLRARTPVAHTWLQLLLLRQLLLRVVLPELGINEQPIIGQ